MKTKPRMGRPPLPPGKKKVWISANLSPEAFRKLSKSAKAAQKSKGQILTELILTPELV